MLSLTESHKRLCEKLRSDLGVKIMDFLQDPDIYEIMVNPNGELWVDSSKLGQTSVGNFSNNRSFSILNSVAGIHGLVISPYYPRLESKLPHFSPMQGERFTGAIPPMVASPCFTIRKRNEIVFTLDDYVQSKRMTHEQVHILRKFIKDRKNILVCGGPGSGKTTMTNALIGEAVKIEAQQRFLILEDLPELQCKARNCVAMLTSETVSMRDLLHAAMRMRPDRILIGEVRGAEALDLLKAWNTGCPGGIGTTHANNAKESMQRIADLAMESGLQQPPWSLLQNTINAVVSIVRRGYQNGFLEEIVTIKGRIHEEFLFEKVG